jgi:hypothetical protein
MVRKAAPKKATVKTMCEKGVRGDMSHSYNSRIDDCLRRSRHKSGISHGFLNQHAREDLK